MTKLGSQYKNTKKRNVIEEFELTIFLFIPNLKADSTNSTIECRD